ncbi:hypothetical protein EMCRGX_G001014 [Ephydatia muelleri]
MQHLPRAPIARSSRRRQQEAALPPPTVFETSSLPSNADLPQSPSNSGRDSSLSFDFASTRTPSSSLDSSVGAAFQESALSRELCTMQKFLSQLSENLRSVEARQIELGTSMDELKQLIQNLTETSFCIKSSIYEQPLKLQIAKLFCSSLKRNPTKESVRVVVARVLTAQVVRTQAYKFDAAVRFANARLSDLYGGPGGRATKHLLEASSMVHRDDPIVDRLIVRYWRQQKTILVILAYLRLMHHVVVGLTWLKKRLAALGLKRRNVVETRLTLVHQAIKLQGLSEKKMAFVRDTYKANPEKKKASVRDSYKADPERRRPLYATANKADPEKKKASVRDSYTTQISNLSNLLKGSDIKTTSRRTVLLI